MKQQENKLRRDKNDIQWQEVKKRVRKRDKNQCQFLKTCTIQEAIGLQKLAPKTLLCKLDCCHIFPVSLYAEVMYHDDNMVLMNRWVHHHLDDCKHPVTGEPITREERDEYWKKIIGNERYSKLQKLIKGDMYV